MLTNVRSSTLRLGAVAFLAALLLLPMAATAQQGPVRTYEVTITNLTGGQIFGPSLVIVHNRKFSLFELGSPASPGVAAMAEDAVLDTLMGELAGDPGVFDTAVAGGPLMPGHSVTLEVESQFPWHFVTATQMLVTTNDAFYALKGVRVPQGPSNDPRSGIRTFFADAYDAGSEVNTEDCDTVPGPPCGNAGVRDTDGAEGYVYVHPGIHGNGDLNPAALDWRNPVAKITIVKKR